MADLKISQLNSIVTVVPATDVLPVVQGGTTLKITPNQILGSGGTATLASATITGAATVGTTLGVTGASTLTGSVGIGAANSAKLSVSDTNGIPIRFGDITTAPVSQTACYVGVSTSALSGSINGDLILAPRTTDVGSVVVYTGSGTSVERFRISGTGICTWSNVGGVAGTAMTLNSTGLGIGVSPGIGFDLQQTSPMVRITGTSTTGYSSLKLRNTGASGRDYEITVGGSGTGATAAGNLYIYDNTAAAVRLLIDSSGNVGIGVTPSAWSTYKALQVTNASLWGAVNNAYVGANYYFDGSNRKYIANGFASEYSQASGVHAWFNAVSGTAAANITFTQAMTLDASGNLLVGTTTNTNSSRVFARGTGGATTLAIQSSTGDTANPGLLVGKFDNDSTTSQILVRFTINNNSGGSGQITANGANAAAFGTFSDSRLKENITSIPSQLAKILSLRPVEFDFKNGSGHQIGFIAQEMQEVYPDVVGEQDGFLTVTGWSKTEARLVSAIKELAAKVQALESKLA